VAAGRRGPQTYFEIKNMNNETGINELKKGINLFDGIALVSGSMIGSGIFIVSADMSRILGSPGWLLFTWLISGLLTIIASNSYGELAAIMPKVGGQYAYLKEVYNPLVGFIYGWTLFLVIQTGTIAAVAIGFAKFSGEIFHGISPDNYLIRIGFLKLSTQHMTAILMILFLTWVNTRGVYTGKTVQNVFTSAKVLAILMLIFIGFLMIPHELNGNFSREVFWNAFRFNENGIAEKLAGWPLTVAVFTAMVGALFSMDAWNNITFTSSEIKNPKRNIPLSLFLGTLLVIFIYLLVNTVYLKVLPLHGSSDGGDVFARGIQYAANDRVATAAMSALIGSFAVIIMAMLVMTSTFGCDNGLILSGSRVYYAMAKDGLFIDSLSKLNKHHVPKNALIIQGIWASILCLTGTYSQLLDYVIFAVLLFYILTILSLFILRKKQPMTERPYKAFGYPYLPAFYIVITSVMMVILLVYKPGYTFPGLLIVLLGIPVYYILKFFRRSGSQSGYKP
jgi:basic amino acid/polyamine antiporter, APA family